MGETVTFNWPMHGQQLCKGMVDLLKENFETDFGLLVRDNKSQMMKVHHVVLAIFCPLLRNVTEKKLNLGKYNVEDLKRLVEFIYTGKTTVNKAGLSRLRCGANAIGLKTLVHSIDTYVRQTAVAADDDDDDDSQTTNHTSSTSNQSSGATADDTQSEDTRPKKAQTTPVSSRKPATPIKSGAASIKSRLRSSAESSVKTRRKTTLKSSRPPPPPRTKMFTCKHCSYSANRNCEIITHMAAVHHLDAEGNKLEKSVKCEQCSFTCYSRDQLKVHRYLKHSKDQLKCDQCPYVCGTRPGMRKHMVTHSEERPLMCELCGARFKRLSYYAEHMAGHQGLKAVCDVCGKTVALSSLKRHEQLHKSAEKPNACHLCPYATRNRGNLRVHLRGVHKVHMDRQGNVLGKDETSTTSKLSSVHSSAEDNSQDCAVNSISNRFTDFI